MTTQLFKAKLDDPAFRDAFAAAPSEQRLELLKQTGIELSLEEAEKILEEAAGAISDDELGNAVGGGAGFFRPPPHPGPKP